MYFHLLNEIKSKEDLLLNSKAIFYSFAYDCQVSPREITELNIAGMMKLFDFLMKSLPSEERKIKSAIRKYYNSKSWFGISNEAMVAYLTDVKKELNKM